MQLIETIIVYKFTKKSRKEIEAMLGLGDIRQSLVYQEALEEGALKGKLETVPLMLKLGATVEQIAKDLDLNVDDVRKAAQENSTN
jgi:predicted transposase/invertase (TIGR01784 family)